MVTGLWFAICVTLLIVTGLGAIFKAVKYPSQGVTDVTNLLTAKTDG